ncbi:arf-GAP domain and FG repeat-containing 1 isoform X11 [Pelobates cultripes]|uniref:Arf-GAP domain and FG repeat-containing 1 isoform X11 n=1 Tax=Pelobates cultripes TaxID=61616 RepID=A0AAD1VSY3_PELCU|nr:arf-GAP domain and FG repeat-containing 1 isoform X11 [Pelobates cultripes]CAH2246552.1 arf-GAP domain and FG repeat-containing 1 isoform X11 [Pelobates cultripes]CAH2246560.1 arf-GAP domain and FG repeat-containing 1 isoform X11 [Pelobates cultripes]
MAASAKRKQEEKHLKLLREMTSLPHNRKCFDCDQRGPTYANMTAGAFVCTSCSGILRGLNPPHRVKSISMTTFTQQEIEFLQKHGNDACKQIWLGLFDDRSSSVPDFRDPQKMKEFLQEKYEKKRWYVPPEQARVVASVHASISGSSASSASSTPEVKPLKTLLGDSAPTLQLNKGTPSQSPVVSRNQPQQQHHQPLEKKPFDLLGDLGADIFATPAPQSAATANFANFANFNSHAGGGQGSAYGSSTGPASSTQAVPAPTDNVFGIGSAMPAGRTHQPASAPGVFGVSASTNPFVSQSVGSAVNPFQSNGRVPQGVRDGHPAEMDYQGTPFHPFHPNRLPTAAGAVDVSSFGTASLSMPAGFGTQTAYSLPTSFSGSFHQPAFPAQTAFPQQTAFSQQPNGNIQGGGFAVFGQAKPMVTPFGQVAAPGVSSNPFMAGAPSGQFPAGSSSTNPFL